MKYTSRNPDNTLFRTPLSLAYVRCAVSELKSTRMIVVTALLAATCALVDLFFLPVGGAFLRIYFSFLIASLLCATVGPALALPAGILVDMLSFFLAGGDPVGYFPGYALSSMLTFLLYALFLYRANLSLTRIFAARLAVNVLINVILGSVWKHILYGSAYIVYFVSGAIKNIALLPVEAALMLMLFRRLIPVLQRVKLIPDSVTVTVRRRDYVFSAIAGVIGIAVLILYYRYKNG